jgi:adenylate kinase
MPLYIVLLGAPGAGKGTQAQIISQRLGIPHISSGSIFRENIQQQTELGIQARKYIDRGELVPDDVTIAMIQDRLLRPDCHSGALLDGFPRTPAQADALANILADIQAQIDAVPYIRVPEAVLVERLTGRWTCRKNGHVFHQKYNPPKEDGKCDYDQSELYQREDDRAATVVQRIRVYLEQTMPLIEYYRQHGVLVEVDGTRPITDVTEELLAQLEPGS